MPEQNGDKSQDATPHRRQQARKEGQVAKSQDLGSALLLVLGLLVLMMVGGSFLQFLDGFCHRQFGEGAWFQADREFAVGLFQDTLWELGRCLLPILGLLMLVAVAVNLAQVGFLFVPDKLAPDITRLDPLKGMKRLFSITSVMRLAFGMFKILVIGVVAFVSLYAEREVIFGLSGLGLREISVYLIQILFWTAMKIGAALVVLAILDYAFQRWKHEQDLKMTQQEVREEMKNLEGNPEIAARRRMVQRQLAMKGLAQAVPKADVVVTNPTELAVAIQYDPETMAAPIVVAKGAGAIAKRIRQLALEHDIPVVEKKPLAQALYREVDLNHPVPQDKYAAVAEVLAYVYQLKGKDIPSKPSRAA